MRRLVIIVALSLTAAFGVETAALPERVVRHVGTVTIEYSKGDEAYAEILAARISDFHLPALPAGGITPGSDLLQHKNEYLARIDRFLALPAGPKRDGVFTMVSSFFNTDLLLPVHYSLWRRPELLARLTVGEAIDGFTLVGPTGINFSTNFPQVENGDDEEARVWPERVRAYWAAFKMPISIGKQATAEADIDAGLKQTTDIIALFRGGDRANPGPFIVLHEATEFTIITKYLVSKDRRWFCDGVANFVAWKVLSERLGVERARQYYDLDEQLRRFSPEAASVDLEKWPAMESIKSGSYNEDLNTANYAFATQVIASVCAKHGEDLLPRLFTEIGKTPREKASMKTVYAAFKKITGEDLRSYLPNAQKPRH